MKPEKRHISWLHQPAKGWVQYQPLGVVGIIAPWNYPLLLSIGPLICALAAGNHAMIKISSASAHFGKMLDKALSEAFPCELVAVVNGGGAISDAFSHLPFDKIIFTGSTSVGKTVMQAAAKT
jgi:coniferyl-aldehyde dehydrogenase